jgi:hypothetical protein
MLFPLYVIWFPSLRSICLRFVRFESAWAMLAAPSFPMLFEKSSRLSYVRFLRVESAWTMLATPSFPILFGLSWSWRRSTCRSKSWGISVKAAARFFAPSSPIYCECASIFSFSTEFMSLNCSRILYPLSCMIRLLLSISSLRGIFANYSYEKFVFLGCCACWVYLFC